MSTINTTSSLHVPRKRTRDHTDDSSELDTRLFQTHKHRRTTPVASGSGEELSESSSTRTFTPVCLIPRANLPLAYLDLSGTRTDASAGRLCAAYIRALEETEEADDGVPVVLIAKETDENVGIGRLFAFERVGVRVYALLRLGGEVRVEDVVGRAKQDSVPGLGGGRKGKRVKIEEKEGMEDGVPEPWWKKATVDVDVPVPAADASASRASSALRGTPWLSMLRPDGIGSQARQTSSSIPVDEPAPIPEVNKSPTAATTPDEVLQELAKRYLEALYVSRTSLAYFAKGPLSRARAAFNSTQKFGELWDVQCLVEFLRASILSSATTDKKYKNGVPDLLKLLRENSPEQAPKRKKKKKWKPRRDKSGFFVDEDGYMQTWWAASEVGGSSLEDVETRVKDMLARMRERESFLQVILILEVLALETCVAPEELCVSKPPQSRTDGTAVLETKPRKTKKEQDLPALLEILLDRLCIWHSLSSHSSIKKAGPSKTATSDGTQLADAGDHDDLSNFCIDVIIPFYAPRIPQYATIVNKKFGGPSPPTPIQCTQAARASKPGQPATRQASEKRVRKPLERVSTNTLNQTSSFKHPPSLHRSATDSDALLSHTIIKREHSFSPNPLHVPSAPPRKRLSLLHSLSFDLGLGKGRREVDLSAFSAATEAKLRKKAETEEKLREAIAAVKKPDRERAGVESARGREEKMERMCVAATPKGVRRRRVDGAVMTETEAVTAIGGTIVVPASTVKSLPQQARQFTGLPSAPSSTPPAVVVPKTLPHAFYRHRPSYAHAYTADVAITSTPSSSSSRHYFPPSRTDPTAHLPLALVSPVPSSSRKSSAMVMMVQRTPSKKATVVASSLVAGTPIRRPTAAEETSIYHTLGWDEDEDDGGWFAE